jgi:hypothetical protein
VLSYGKFSKNEGEPELPRIVSGKELVSWITKN